MKYTYPISYVFSVWMPCFKGKLARIRCFFQTPGGPQVWVTKNSLVGVTSGFPIEITGNAQQAANCYVRNGEVQSNNISFW